MDLQTIVDTLQTFAIIALCFTCITQSKAIKILANRG